MSKRCDTAQKAMQYTRESTIMLFFEFQMTMSEPEPTWNMNVNQNDPTKNEETAGRMFLILGIGLWDSHH